jgi:hypothetical protein
MPGAATEDLSERIGSDHGGPEPGPSGRRRQVSLSTRAAGRDHRGVVHTCAGAPGRVPDGPHDLGRDQPGVHRAGHLGSSE